MAGRNRPSSIDRLPEPVQEAIAALRRQGRTVDEILEHLRALDLEVSRSALGRHIKTMAEIGDQLRRAETMAKFVVDRFGEESDERVGRANMRILQGALLEILTEDRVDEDGAKVSLSVDEAKSISLALQRLTASAALDADRQIKIEAATRRKMAAEVEAGLKKVGKQQGWSKETAQLVRANIFGVRPDQVADDVVQGGSP